MQWNSEVDIFFAVGVGVKVEGVRPILTVFTHSIPYMRVVVRSGLYVNLPLMFLRGTKNTEQTRY